LPHYSILTHCGPHDESDSGKRRVTFFPPPAKKQAKGSSVKPAIAVLMIGAATVAAWGAEPPRVQDRAPEFSLSAVTGGMVRLSEALSSGPVVLVVLRGYPGYQCPFCNRQVQDYLNRSADFARLGARVLLVYPGPGDMLNQRASEFLAGRMLPANFSLLLDPDYQFTNLYGLRWEAPKETAYPSTFLIDAKGSVFFAKVAKAHGGRTTAAEMLAELARHKSM
jgi:peroxiredoxin